MCVNVGYAYHRLVGYRFLSQLRCGSLVTRVGHKRRSFANTTRAACFSSSGDGSGKASEISEKEERTLGILQSWTDSVLLVKDNKRDSVEKPTLVSAGQDIFKRSSIQRGEIKAGEQNSRLNLEGQKEKRIAKKTTPAPVYRRRMADSSWTKEPMDDKLIWVDCEMTGLNPESDMIMEIGCIITDSNLKEIASQPSIIIHVPEEKLETMGIWCVKHHGESGLTEACRQSMMTSAEVDEQLFSFVQKHTKAGECPMAGNSIYMDRVFITKQFPKFHSHFHYRNVDVSTLKELVRRWYPLEYSQAPKKKFAHRVLDDIKDSIAELEYYKFNVMKQTDSVVVKKSNI